MTAIRLLEILLLPLLLLLLFLLSSSSASSVPQGTPQGLPELAWCFGFATSAVPASRCVVFESLNQRFFV